MEPTMSINPASLFRISYRMERGDFVALTRHVTARRPRLIALGIVVITLWVALLIFIDAGSFENLPQYLADHLVMPLLIVHLPLYLLGVVVILGTPRISAFIANFTYPAYPNADREVVLDLTAQGIEGGELYPDIGWAALKRITETPTHLFLEVSHQQTLVIPRRAIDNEDTYRNILGFIRARTGLSTTH